MRDNNEDGTPPGGSVRNPAATPAAAAPVTAPTALPVPETAQDDMASEASRPVSADMQQFIGRQLRAVFDDVAKQPVPDRFLELMKQLDKKTGTG